MAHNNARAGRARNGVTSVAKGTAVARHLGTYGSATFAR